MNSTSPDDTVGASARAIAPLPPAPYDIVVDLETLGTKPGAVIASIGAVCLFPGMPAGWALPFYARVDIADATNRGLTIDTDTVLWWLTEPSWAARVEIFHPDHRATLPGALERLNEWAAGFHHPKGEPHHWWGKGPTFDLAILRAGYEACGMDCPFLYHRERCIRTAGDMSPGSGRVTFDPFETPHHAGDDAMAEARYLARCRAGVSVPRPVNVDFLRKKP